MSKERRKYVFGTNMVLKWYKYGNFQVRFRYDILKFRYDLGTIKVRIMRDVILRGRAAKILVAKHGADMGTYKPLVILLSDRDFMMLSPETQEGLLRTRFSNEMGNVYIVIGTDLYDRIDITARQRIRCRGFGTPEEAVDFAIRNVGLLAALAVF